MSSTYYQSYTEQSIINFPKKTAIQKINKKPVNYMATNYDVLSTADRFDPNMASSPPNIFMNTLQQRMNVYCTNIADINVGGNARSRALSFGK